MKMLRKTNFNWIKALCIFFLIIFFDSCSQNSLNNEVEGDYNLFLKPINSIEYQKSSFIYHFKDGKLSSTDLSGNPGITNLLYEVIDKDKVDFIGKTNGGDIKRESRFTQRDKDGKLISINWRDVEITSQGLVDYEYAYVKIYN